MLTDKKKKEFTRLLEAINETGSIRSASVELGVTYKTAWKRLDSLKNLYSEYRIIESFIGGDKGGGSFMTPDGRRILRELKLGSK
jgi:molybdate transport system regulatory protein